MPGGEKKFFWGGPVVIGGDNLVRKGLTDLSNIGGATALAPLAPSVPASLSSVAAQVDHFVIS